MDKPEQIFWTRLRKHVPGFIQRIETTTGCGVPDVYCCWKGKPFWLELKVWTPDVGILMRKEQWAWAKQHFAQSAGQSFVVTQLMADAIVVMHISEIKVEAYGTQEKYVVATHKNQYPPRGLCYNMVNLKGTLEKWLFPEK
jgi:hypothetical protein